MASSCASLECPALLIGGTADHIHILCRLGRTHSISELIRKIKAGSSAWLKKKTPELSDFAWQSGYGAFSIGMSSIDSVKKYISTQNEHHQRRTFQEEFLIFLKKYHLKYDEKYLWD